MKRIIKWSLALLAVLAVAAALVYFAFPGVLVNLAQSQAASSAGLIKKTLRVDGYDMHYYEGGTGEPLVLLHGMADEKNSFVQSAAHLTTHYRVILPDLMGHGENTRDPARNYSIRGHVLQLQKMKEALGLQSFYLGGNSMGGHISAAYALAYPEQVKKLVLVNAPGLDIDVHVVYGGLAKKMETAEDFYAVMDRVVHKRPAMPAPVVNYMIKQVNHDLTLSIT